MMELLRHILARMDEVSQKRRGTPALPKGHALLEKLGLQDRHRHSATAVGERTDNGNAGDATDDGNDSDDRKR